VMHQQAGDLEIRIHVREARNCMGGLFDECQPGMDDLEIEIGEIDRGPVNIVHPIRIHWHRPVRNGLVDRDRLDAKLLRPLEKRIGEVRIVHAPRTQGRDFVRVELQADRIGQFLHLAFEIGKAYIEPGKRADAEHRSGTGSAKRLATSTFLAVNIQPVP